MVVDVVVSHKQVLLLDFVGYSFIVSFIVSDLHSLC